VVGGAGLILHTTTSGASWETESSGGAGELDHIVVVDTLGGWIAGFGGVILHNDFGPGVLTDTLSLSTGWNILSLPLSVADNQKSSLFPDAVSRAFLYDNGSGYRSTDTLTPGRGYWVKFSAAEQVPVTGQSIDALTVNLTAGWNLVGGISSDVPVNSIVQNPPGSVSSPPFGYSGTYYVATTIQHGVGYWIRTSQACQLTFQSGFHSAVARKYQIDVNSLRADELPPPPPGGFPPPASAAQLPGRFMLEQNYPNPFNPSTELSFDVRDVSRVTLRIYDLLGREVATLVDGVREPGRYSAAWDASRMPGGIYFAKMTAAGGEQYEATRKLVLLR
jgi:hypothetical protein